MKTINYQIKLILLALLFSFYPLICQGLPLTTKAIWSYTAFGSGIGLSGIASGNVRTNLELYMGGSGATFGGNGYWYALRWNRLNKRFDTVFTSQYSPNGIIALREGDTHSNVGREIAVVETDGTIRFYKQINKIRLNSFKMQIGSISAAELKDMDGDGLDDIVALGDNGLAVYNAKGVKLWEIGSVSGTSLVIGQMDSDSAFEIALTDGNIIDAATKTVQWKRASGFGRHLQSADIDNDGIEELIAAEAWQIVWAFDVDKKLPKWSITTPQDIGAIKVADIDKDGVQELLIGDGQWGSVYAINTQTKQKEWSIGNPEHGVTNIAFADTNMDGINEVFWGAGATSTGSDHLYVADITKKNIIWQNEHLDGPFLKPAIGDVDGDGKPELVTATFSSDSGYGSARILVFDGYTLELKGISKPIANNSGWTGLHDLKLRNVTAHAGLEIVVASDWLYDGLLEVYSFNAGTFKKVWTNPVRPSGSPFYSVEIADLDKDGKREFIFGGGREHTGADGVFLYLYDFATKAETWRSFQIGDYWGNISNLVVGDLDNDNDLDYGGLASNGEFAVFDGPTKDPLALFNTSGKNVQVLTGRNQLATLIIDDQLGGVDYYRYQDSTKTFTITKHVRLDDSALSGFKFRKLRDVWYGIDGVIKNLDLNTNQVVARTLNYGPGLGKDIAFLYGTKYGDLAITGSFYGIFGFPVTNP